MGVEEKFRKLASSFNKTDLMWLFYLAGDLTVLFIPAIFMAFLTAF